MAAKRSLTIKRAFSLVEILIVIAIILLLAALLFPVLARAKESTARAVALTQAQELGKSLTLYNLDTENRYLPSTNYGLPDSSPNKMWPNGLMAYVKDKEIYIAPESKGIYPTSFADRGMMTVGYSSATAIDLDNGCDDDQANSDGCTAFNSVASFDKEDKPAQIALLALTPGGPTTQGYRGYEFNPYNGVPNPDDLPESPPLTSDRDLVKELAGKLPPQAIEPVYGRYFATGHDTGETYVIFADGHAKTFSAAQILAKHSGIIWRFR
jgi:prepilin-type N-terminal cleavage/methylation domain-containing protein